MARELHKTLLAKVVNASAFEFFDLTPHSKLVDNFTTDIEKADRSLFQKTEEVLASLIDCLVMIGLALYFSPFMIIAVSVNLYFLIKLSNYVMPAKDEC